jgi:hypothetical protein
MPNIKVHQYDQITEREFSLPLVYFEKYLVDEPDVHGVKWIYKRKTVYKKDYNASSAKHRKRENDRIYTLAYHSHRSGKKIK